MTREYDKEYPSSNRAIKTANEIMGSEEVSLYYPAAYGSLVASTQYLADIAQKMAEEWLRGEPDTISLSSLAKRIIDQIKFMEEK